VNCSLTSVCSVPPELPSRQLCLPRKVSHELHQKRTGSIAGFGDRGRYLHPYDPDTPHPDTRIHTSLCPPSLCLRAFLFDVSAARMPDMNSRSAARRRVSSRSSRRAGCMTWANIRRCPSSYTHALIVVVILAALEPCVGHFLHIEDLGCT